ncbi:MAG: histidine kinase, partial [Draconibacterium sp.]|nr:histidine kinase [Draconibacterium sp.]
NAELNNLPHSKKRKQKDYQSVFYEKSWNFDADNDGMDEIVSYNPNSLTFEIYNPGNSNISQLQIPSLFVILKVYPFLINGKVEKLMISTNSGYFFLSYAKNPYYWSKYFIWFAIFFTAYIITFLIQYFQRRRMEAKWETEKQLTELQFNTIKNQLNPHFVFNALSSVGYLIESGKKEEAYDFLSVNTRLIRKVLDDAELTSRSLAAEINFVKDYLSIQEFRFKDRFRINFYIDESVNLQLAVPKMVLHTYIENAVKHGFKNINSGGILEIRIESLPKGVIFTVRDNGHSEDLPVESPENTGKGIKIMESYYCLFEKQHKCKIQTTLKKINETEPSQTGTEVTVKIEY